MPTSVPRIGLPRRVGMLLATLVITLGTAGCKTGSVGSTSKAAQGQDVDQIARMAESLEREFTIGPRMARTFGYRIAWQSPDAGQDNKMIQLQEDSIFLLSDDNSLMRLTTDTGTRLWSVSVGSPAAEILGITYMPDEQRIYVTRDSTIMTLESATGVLTSKEGRSPVQDLQWIANTKPVHFANYLVYGSRAGEVVWQAYHIGHSYRAYKIGQSIKLAPQLSGDTLIAVATSGEIVAMDADNVTSRWRHKLLDRIVAEPAMGPTAVYVSSQDQYLRAFDLGTGRLLWRALTESPLDSKPTIIRRHVYQQVPGAGLSCYEALPVNRYDGLRTWINPEVTGSVITKRRDNLVTWDESTHELCLVSAGTGVIETRLQLPTVHRIVTDSKVDGRLYTLDDRGRLDCLVPTN